MLYLHGMGDYDLSRKMMLKSRKDISRVFADGMRTGDRQLLVIALKNDANTEYSRVCVAVSKKHGNAVQRNRLKRLLREAYRLTGSARPAGYDIVLLPRVGVKFDLEGLKKSIGKLLPLMEAKYGRKR